MMEGYHAQVGLWFHRLDDGSVRVRKTDVQATVVEWETVIPAEGWASVVASVSALGEDGPTWRKVLEFHQRETAGTDA